MDLGLQQGPSENRGWAYEPDQELQSLQQSTPVSCSKEI